MGVAVNFQQKLDAVLAELSAHAAHVSERPRLLLHSCCGPCSSYVLEYLSAFFSITVFYDNPNIYPPKEYYRRRDEQCRLIHDISADGSIGYVPDFIEAAYEPARYDAAVVNVANTPEGGARCFACYEFRLRDTALYAASHGFDFFTTTLSISPFKNATWINAIGEQLERELSVSRDSVSGVAPRYLYADFKKRNGFKRSLELSEKYGLYRQHYCGCVYSLREAEQRNGK